MEFVRNNVLPDLQKWEKIVFAILERCSKTLVFRLALKDIIPTIRSVNPVLILVQLALSQPLPV